MIDVLHIPSIVSWTKILPSTRSHAHTLSSVHTTNPHSSSASRDARKGERAAELLCLGCRSLVGWRIIIPLGHGQFSRPRVSGGGAIPAASGRQDTKETIANTSKRVPA